MKKKMMLIVASFVLLLPLFSLANDKEQDREQGEKVDTRKGNDLHNDSMKISSKKKIKDQRKVRVKADKKIVEGFAMEDEGQWN